MKMKATLVVEVLRKNLPKGNLTVGELRMGSGYGAAEQRTIDLWTIDSGPATGNRAVSYEVKVDRSDFLGDIRSPVKQRGARLFSDQFYYVVPQGLVKVEEIPCWAGLIEIVPVVEEKHKWRGHMYDGVRLMIQYTLPAPILSKASPSWPLVVSLLRRLPLVRDLWKHKKGGTYELVGHGIHSETLEELTAYVGEDGQMWFRPRAMFEDGRFVREEEL